MNDCAPKQYRRRNTGRINTKIASQHGLVAVVINQNESTVSFRIANHTGIYIYIVSPSRCLSLSLSLARALSSVCYGEKMIFIVDRACSVVNDRINEKVRALVCARVYFCQLCLSSLSQREREENARTLLGRFSIATSIILKHSRDQRRCAFFELLLLVVIASRSEGDGGSAFIYLFNDKTGVGDMKKSS